MVVDAVLNDRERNIAADLFLCRYGFDTTVKEYRYLRSAMLLFAYAKTPFYAYSYAAASEGMDITEFLPALYEYVLPVKPNMPRVYNSRYAPPRVPFERECRRITMKNSDLDGIIGFLSTVFYVALAENYVEVGE